MDGLESEWRKGGKALCSTRKREKTDSGRGWGKKKVESLLGGGREKGTQGKKMALETRGEWEGGEVEKGRELLQVTSSERWRWEVARRLTGRGRECIKI